MTHFYYMVSTSVGSGKTTAATNMMARTRTQNYLYIAPTIKLAMQTVGDLHKAGVSSVRVIHNENTYGVTGVALAAINDSIPNTGNIIVLTTATFLTILADITGNAGWKVLLDEAFQPLDVLTYKSTKNMKMFLDLFDIDSAGHVAPAKGKAALVKAIGAGKASKDDEFGGTPSRDICEKVSNPAIRCEVVKEANTFIRISGYVQPEAFESFQDVYFMSALFEQSILYRLWTKRHGVQFMESPDFDVSAGLIDVHQTQGPHVKVGHLLHKDDQASKYTLQRNVSTGKAGERGIGSRVVDYCLTLAVEFFKGEEFLYQANKWFWANPSTLPNVMRSEVYIHGQNDYRQHVNAVALAVTNPRPEVRDWIMERTALSAQEVYMAHRIHTVYQFFGRTGVRTRGDNRVKTFITAGYEDAMFIHELFDGSEFIGKVGDIGCMRDKELTRRKAQSVNSLPEYVEATKKVKSIRARVKRGTAVQSELDTAIAERDAVVARLKAA